MKLSHLKTQLANNTTLDFWIKNTNIQLPTHFHITEMGIVQKHFIDCGGTIRQDNRITFQLWVADDISHQLSAKKALKIIEITEKNWQNQFPNLAEWEIEVEYQTETIGKYTLEFENNIFWLVPTQTACLAQDQCGINTQETTNQTTQKIKKDLATLTTTLKTETACCGGKCC